MPGFETYEGDLKLNLLKRNRPQLIGSEFTLHPHLISKSWHFYGLWLR